MQEFDFAIVGAGIAGVSAAYHLAPHARVIVLEREHVAAYHTTGRSAALHSETYGSAEIRAITVASGRFYRNPPAGFADHPLLTPRGALIVGRAEQEADMKEAASDFGRLVPSVRWLDPAETLRLQPLFKPEAASGGAIFEPEADDMDVAAIHGGFLRGARAAAAELRLNAEVTALSRKDGRWQIGLPAGETPSAPCDAQPEEIDIAVAVERIETATTLQIRRIKNKWAGLRSFVADKNLVVGYDPKVEGFFWLAGQGGYGIQTGAAAGRLAASLALGKGLPGDIVALGVREAALSPARFTQG